MTINVNENRYYRIRNFELQKLRERNNLSPEEQDEMLSFPSGYTLFVEKSGNFIGKNEFNKIMDLYASESKFYLQGSEIAILNKKDTRIFKTKDVDIPSQLLKEKTLLSVDVEKVNDILDKHNLKFKNFIYLPNGYFRKIQRSKKATPLQIVQLSLDLKVIPEELLLNKVDTKMIYNNYTANRTWLRNREGIVFSNNDLYLITERFLDDVKKGKLNNHKNSKIQNFVRNQKYRQALFVSGRVLKEIVKDTDFSFQDVVVDSTVYSKQDASNYRKDNNVGNKLSPELSVTRSVEARSKSEEKDFKKYNEELLQMVQALANSGSVVRIEPNQNGSLSAIIEKRKEVNING